MVAFAVLTGTIHDKTTGQPLTGVTVTTRQGPNTFTARSDSNGRFTLRGLADGKYTLHLSSHDVPAQDFQVRIEGSQAHVNLRACSTTLDYSCGGGGYPSGGGG